MSSAANIKCTTCARDMKCPQCWNGTDEGCNDMEPSGSCPFEADYTCMNHSCAVRGQTIEAQRAVTKQDVQR